MRNRNNWSLLLFALLAIAIAQGCENSAQEEQKLCSARIRLAVLEIWDSTSIKDPTGSSYERAASQLRELLGHCSIPRDGVSISGNTSIQAAEIYLLAGLYDEVQEQLRNLAALDNNERVALLFTAARYGNLEVLQAIVDSGVDANSTDELGSNAISGVVGSHGYAAEKIRFLIESGVSPIAENGDGFSALDAAILAGDADVASEILKLLDSNDPGARMAVEDALEIASKVDSPLQALLEMWLGQA